MTGECGIKIELFDDKFFFKGRAEAEAPLGYLCKGNLQPNNMIEEGVFSIGKHLDPRDECRQCGGDIFKRDISSMMLALHCDKCGLWIEIFDPENTIRTYADLQKHFKARKAARKRSDLIASTVVA